MNKSTIKRTVAISLLGLSMLSSAYFIENTAIAMNDYTQNKSTDVLEAVVGGVVATGSLLGAGCLYTSKKDDYEVNNLDCQNEKTL